MKQYRVPSFCQEAILEAFEEEGWPPAIDDPLPPHPEQDPKRRLRNTIKSLNANQEMHSCVSGATEAAFASCGSLGILAEMPKISVRGGCRTA